MPATWGRVLAALLVDKGWLRDGIRAAGEAVDHVDENVGETGLFVDLENLRIDGPRLCLAAQAGSASMFSGCSAGQVAVRKRMAPAIVELPSGAVGGA